MSTRTALSRLVLYRAIISMRDFFNVPETPLVAYAQHFYRTINPYLYYLYMGGLESHANDPYNEQIER
ncbi:hypothetical protein VNO77_23087 [Canavalia gladiata]|uniref:Uncharacterized protein n=1 Tax=Canavalia gladiata TaxID=3824 RepID=A0AAN9L4D2_CANGL